MNYSGWTKQALIERIRELEGAGRELEGIGDVFETKPARQFDFTKFPRRKIALKFSYLGWPYHGLACQGDGNPDTEEKYPTVEGELFKALIRSKLIVDQAECGYSRCGRTDRGVSGFGQVAALYVRSLGKFVNEEPVGGMVTRDIQNQKRPVLLPKDTEELPYVSILNKALPPEIRVLAWSPVDPEFDARFSCKWRFYRYFFNQQDLDIEQMRRAAERFGGTHDFRNFCRLDPAKQITNFERTVLDIKITKVSGHLVGSSESDEGRWWQLELRGTAFLWHQVRCMMAVLFLVGQGREQPEAVDQMLDVERTPGKPEYEMAADTPLVLADCAYEEGSVDWRYPLRLDQTISRQWGKLTTQSVVASALLEQVREGAKETQRPGVAIRLDVGWNKSMKKYVPIMQRKRADAVENRNRAWWERKGSGRSKAVEEDKQAAAG